MSARTVGVPSVTFVGVADRGRTAKIVAAKATKKDAENQNRVTTDKIAVLDKVR